MALPPLDHRGLLPAGIHLAGWGEIQTRFATNPHRAALFQSLQQFVSTELEPVAAGLELVLGGSYFTDKPTPGDVDCTVIIPVQAIAQRVPLLTLAMRDGAKGRIWQQYKVELYPSVAAPGANDLRAFFQYVGAKTALAKSLNAKDLKGIVQVEPWTLG